MRNEMLFVMANDDDFQKILAEDKILNELEAEKNNATDEYFQLMMVLSKIFKIGGISVSCITPAIWAYLFSIGNGYTIAEKPITDMDTDIFIYILSKGLTSINQNIVENAAGFCKSNNLDYFQTQADLKTLIYLSFRPLEMLKMLPSIKGDGVRFNADWLTKITSVVCPMTNKTSDEVIFNMSLTEVFYYFVQMARKTDTNNLIKRLNSDQINQAIFTRTMELGKQYYQTHYGRGE